MIDDENMSVQLLVRITPTLLDSLKNMANEEKTTVSEVCRDALQERIEWYTNLEEL